MSDPKPRGAVGALAAIWRGINLVRLLIINLVFFSLLLLVVMGISYLVAAHHQTAVREGSLLVLKPEGRLVEQYSIDPMSRVVARLSGNEVQQVRVRDLVAAINRATHDHRIRQILLMPDGLHAGGFAALLEIGAALKRFRAAGKKVTAWGVDMDQSQYYLASYADRVLIDPRGGILVTGLSNYRLYYKDLLDRLGVSVHLFRVGQYKSAAEPLVLDHASDAAKLADRFWLGGLWTQWLDTVARHRKLDPKALGQYVDNLADDLKQADGDLAKLSLQQHLVDGLATRQQLIVDLRKAGVPAGRHGHGVRSVAMDTYLQDTNHPDLSALSQPAVAVVVAEGDIVAGRQPPGSIGGESTAALIREARENPHVKAVVLRVDSPGGQVFAAEQIRREVALTRQAGKPVVVSMGDVAASGGYLISMDANQIFAEPDTITGSIGIFGTVINVPDTLARFGVHSDGVATGPLAGAFDPTRALNPKVGELIQAMINKGYQDFVGGVAKARGKSFQQIDAIAQGRVWTGRQAHQRGLVDKLGGFEAAVRAAAGLAGLGKHYRVQYVSQPLSGFERFALNFSQSAAAHALISAGVRLPPWMARVPHAAAELKLFESMRNQRPQVYAYCFCGAH